MSLEDQYDACAGGGRAGCTAKDFYTYKLPHKADREDDQ